MDCRRASAGALGDRWFAKLGVQVWQSVWLRVFAQDIGAVSTSLESLDTSSMNFQSALAADNSTIGGSFLRV
jgi:hypothetical protein